MTTYPNAPGFERGSETSKAAAESVEHTAASLREKVFDLICQYPGRGLTDFEIQALSGHLATVRPRRCELSAAGRIIPNGLKRLSPSGREAKAYVQAPPGPSEPAVTPSPQKTPPPVQADLFKP